VKAIAQLRMTQTERQAFGLSLRAVVTACVTASVMKRHPSRLDSLKPGFIGSNWKHGGNSIRGASPLVANG